MLCQADLVPAHNVLGTSEFSLPPLFFSQTRATESLGCFPYYFYLKKKKVRKTIEWERLEISSRKLEIPRENAKMGTIKDRNGMDLIEAEDIKKRWQEYTEDRKSVV